MHVLQTCLIYMQPALSFWADPADLMLWMCSWLQRMHSQHIKWLPQVSTDANAERVEKLGVGRITGALLVALWAGVLVGVIVYRRHADYVHHEALYWWEAFYRTGSIIFGGGQVSISPQPYSAL